MMKVLLIGFGAIGRELMRQLQCDTALQVTGVLTPASDSREGPLGGVSVVRSVGELREMPDFAIECAGAGAVREHVIELLRRGVDVGLCSTGALIDDELMRGVRAAAIEGRSQVHLVAGAIGGIDALASAVSLGLESVVLTSRKPPMGWLGTPAEQICNLKTLQHPVVLFHGCAREAARLYPRNANSAATVALAGIGFERTVVTLIADPAIASNMHEIEARGVFGEMRFTCSNRALPDNPKTSALTVLSVVRAARNRDAAVVI